MNATFRVLINPNAAISFPLIQMEGAERVNGKRRTCVKVAAGELSRVIEKEMKCEFAPAGKTWNTGTIKELRRQPDGIQLILEY